MNDTQESDKTQTAALTERSEIMAEEGLISEQVERTNKRSCIY